MARLEDLEKSVVSCCWFLLPDEECCSFKVMILLVALLEKLNKHDEPNLSCIREAALASSDTIFQLD